MKKIETKIPRHSVYIVKVYDDKEQKTYYVEWKRMHSVDMPMTYGMSLKKFKEYLKHTYGVGAWGELKKQLYEAQKNGCSPYPLLMGGRDCFFKYNRAGQNEEFLNKEEILNQYCRNK